MLEKMRMSKARACGMGQKEKKIIPRSLQERSWNGYLSEVGPHVESLENNQVAWRRPQGSKETQRAPTSPIPSSPCSGRIEKGTYSNTLKRLGGQNHKEKR